MATENKSTGLTSKETLLSFLNALNEEDFETARSFVTDDLRFEGVLGARDGAAAYFTDMERMKFKYAIKNVIAEGNDVAALFDVTIQGMEILTAGWYHLTGGKINSIRVIFDPRPLFEKKD